MSVRVRPSRSAARLLGTAAAGGDKGWALGAETVGTEMGWVTFQHLG